MLALLIFRRVQEGTRSRGGGGERERGKRKRREEKGREGGGEGKKRGKGEGKRRKGEEKRGKEEKGKGEKKKGARKGENGSKSSIFRRKPAAGGKFFGVFRERSIGFSGILKSRGGKSRGRGGKKKWEPSWPSKAAKKNEQ